MMEGDNYKRLQSSHPCFGGVNSNKGRIHLPVSPSCNIACRFCHRVISDSEERPGVTAQVVSPQEAPDVVRRALSLCPEISVVGIAGPGDTLASDFAFDTFALIGREFPQLLKCMSTNGLLLSERSDEVVAAGVDSLTVTVNAVDPSIEAALNKWVIYHGRRLEGEEAASILIENQLAGIRKVTSSGVTVKVNTVLVPGVNSDHIEAVAREVAQAGAAIYNIIPLIPQYELSGYPAPTCMEIERSRAAAAPYIDVFRHCQHCRADAAGLLGGKDVHALIYQRRLEIMETFSHG